MQVNISGHQLDVTDAMREYVGEKLGKLERHFDKITNVQVIMQVEKLKQQVEATLHVAGRAARVLHPEVGSRPSRIGAEVLPRARLGDLATGGRSHPVGRQGHRGEQGAGVGGAAVGRLSAGADLENGARSSRGLDLVRAVVSKGGAELNGHDCLTEVAGRVRAQARSAGRPAR